MISVEPAKLSDILLINELAYRIWPVTYKDILPEGQMEYMLDLTYSPSSLEKQMKEMNHKFIIVFDNKIAVGFASYSSKIDASQTFRLHKIYVLPGEQGKGIGKLVLNKIFEDIKPLGAKFLELNVNRNNNALDFYKKNGFEIIAEQDIDIDNGYFMNDYVMRKRVM